MDPREFSLQNLFPQKRSYGQAESSFHRFYQDFFKCRTRSQRSSKSWFDKKKLLKRLILFSSYESTFLRIVSVKHGKQFCREAKKLPTKIFLFCGTLKPKFVKPVERPKAILKTQVFQKVEKSFHGHQESSFDNTSEKVSTSGQIFSTQNHKMLKRFYFSQKD